MLYRVQFLSKSLLYESTLIFIEKSGNYGTPKTWKNLLFFLYWAPLTSPPSIFQQIWGYFHKANFWSRKGSRKAIFQTNICECKTSKFRVFRFVHKNLKVKNAYLGGFWAKNKKNRIWSLPPNWNFKKNSLRDSFLLQKFA